MYLAEEQSLIDKNVWGIWKSGVENAMKHRFFVEAWHFAKEQVDLSGTFENMVESYIAKNNHNKDLAA